MRSRWLWMVLVVSLVANIGFVGGFVGASLQREEASTPLGAAQLLVQRLGLDPQQVSSLNRHRGAAQRANRDLTRESRADVEAFWLELLKGEPDRDRLKLLTGTVAERQTAFTLTVAEELRAFMADLQPDQKQRFARLVRNRPIFQGQFLMTTRPSGQPGS